MGILSIESVMFQLNIYKLLYGSNRLERRRKLGLASGVIPEKARGRYCLRRSISGHLQRDWDFGAGPRGTRADNGFRVGRPELERAPIRRRAE